MDFTVTNTTREYGARCRELKLQQIYSETINGEMVFDKSRLFLRNVLPLTGTTLISVHTLQDVTHMMDIFAYPRSDKDEGADQAIAKYHDKFGPYTYVKFEEKFNRLFSALKRCGTTDRFKKLDILKRIYENASATILFIKEYSEQLLLLLYDDGYKVCDLFRSYSNEPKQSGALQYIHQYIDKVEDLIDEHPHLIYRVSASSLDRFLTKKSYKHMRHGLQQFWIDPQRASVVAKHYDKYFRELWLSWMTRNFRLPEYICLQVVEWLLFAKTNTFVGETILGFLRRTHDSALDPTDLSVSTKIKRVSRDVTIVNGAFLDVINVEIFI
jgi:hypothetical protein